MFISNARPVLAGLVLSALPAVSLAAPTTFTGLDPTAGGTNAARPNSNAAAANFDAALGSGRVGLIDFEAVTDGFAGPGRSDPVFAGVVAGQVNTSTGGGVETGTNSSILGFNTTIGGTKFLQHVPQTGNSQTFFDFASPIDSFGAYFTSVGTSTNSIRVEFNDGTGRSYPLVGSNSASTLFFGFVGADAPISRVEVNLSGAMSGPGFDNFGIDDIRFGSIPEPASLGLLSLMGLSLGRRRR